MTNVNHTTCPVNSYNEWDPLEEVIVGNPENAMFTFWDPIDKLIFSAQEIAEIQKWLTPDAPYPEEYIAAAGKDLEGFVNLLRSEGIIVRHIDNADYSARFSTPDWELRNGFCGTNPRDPFLIVGNEIIETPMCARCRYFEPWAYRSLFNEYFKAGARWTSAPRPQLKAELYKKDFVLDGNPPGNYVLTEFEPVFDAADFVRCGRDIFGQLSHLTNEMGVMWLRRHLGENYRIHLIQSLDAKASHIDTTFMPLAPGKVLVNAEFTDPDALPDILNSWDILIAPEPVPYQTEPKLMSNWIGMNVLMLDETRVVVEKRQEPLIKALKDWGFDPIPCAFENYYPFVGGFHCATLDVRRKGELRSYF